MLEHLELPALVGVLELDLARATPGTTAGRSQTRATASCSPVDRGPAHRGRGDRLHRGDREPGRDAGALVDLRRLPDRPGEPGDDLEQVVGHDRRRVGAVDVPDQRRLLRDQRQLVGEVERVVGAHLGAEAVLERGDDPAAVGVVLRVGAGDQQQVQRQPQLVAAHLDVALLQHVEQRDLDPLGQVGQLVDGEDAAVGARHQAVVHGLRVAERAALGHLDRVDVADQVADAGVRGGQLLAVPLAAVPPGRPACSSPQLGDEPAPPQRTIGAYGWSLISQPAITGVHSSSRPTRVRISRVLPWPRSPSSTRSWPASSARSTSGTTVSSKPTMPGSVGSPAAQPGEQVLAGSRP